MRPAVRLPAWSPQELARIRGNNAADRRAKEAVRPRRIPEQHVEAVEKGPGGVPAVALS